jgi:CTP:molybdopterin cytidylyltransferase MocA
MPARLRHSTVVVLLAAGAGSRFEGDVHKLSAILPETAHHPEQTVLERSLTHAIDAEVGPIVVVTGAADIGPADSAPGSAPDARSGLVRPEVTICHNDRWADGQITSLHAGIDAARALGATNVVVGLADQPGIGADAWRTVAATDGPIVVATYAGRRANPVKLDQAVWPLLPTTGDEGARALMRVRPELIREVPCSGHPTDIDTTEDLRRWQNN